VEENKKKIEEDPFGPPTKLGAAKSTSKKPKKSKSKKTEVQKTPVKSKKKTEKKKQETTTKTKVQKEISKPTIVQDNPFAAWDQEIQSKKINKEQNPTNPTQTSKSKGGTSGPNVTPTLADFDLFNSESTKPKNELIGGFDKMNVSQKPKDGWDFESQKAFKTQKPVAPQSKEQQSTKKTMASMRSAQSNEDDLWDSFNSAPTKPKTDLGGSNPFADFSPTPTFQQQQQQQQQQYPYGGRGGFYPQQPPYPPGNFGPYGVPYGGGPIPYGINGYVGGYPPTMNYTAYDPFASLATGQYQPQQPPQSTTGGTTTKKPYNNNF